MCQQARMSPSLGYRARKMFMITCGAANQSSWGGCDLGLIGICVCSLTVILLQNLIPCLSCADKRYDYCSAYILGYVYGGVYDIVLIRCLR
jgi:hypothetical protein